MKIREYAKLVGFEIVGKLSRFPKGETYGIDYRKQRAYIDEAGNEYYTDSGDACGCCIVTADGRII